MQAKEHQLEQILSLLHRAQKEHEFAPEICDYKVNSFLKANINNPKVLIAVNKDVTAIIILVVTSDFFSYGRVIKDLVFYSETPGAGIRLLKEAQKWIEGWGDSIYAAYLGTSTADENVDRMMEKFGMKKVGSQFIFNRGEK